MRIKKYIRILFWVSFVVFILNKLYFRPWVLENDLPNAFNILVLSLPNFIEVVLGFTVVTRILFQAKRHFNSDIKVAFVYLITMLFVAIYVISQELGFHHIGGNNVYDYYDLMASVLGLVFILSLFNFFGFVAESGVKEPLE